MGVFHKMDREIYRVGREGVVRMKGLMSFAIRYDAGILCPIFRSRLRIVFSERHPHRPMIFQFFDLMAGHRQDVRAFIRIPQRSALKAELYYLLEA